MNIVEYANSFVNKASYVFGADNPETLQFDCSSFVKHVYSKFGISLGRTTFQQVSSGKEVKLSDAKAGDIIFFENTYTAGVSHVGIYAGNNLFIHNSSSKGTVIVSDLNSSYYQEHFHSVRRVLEAQDSDVDIEKNDDKETSNQIETSILGSVSITIMIFFIICVATVFFIQAFNINIF